MLLMKIRRARRTKPRLRDKQPKLRIKGKPPTQRMLAKLREQASRTRPRLFRDRTRQKGSWLRTRRLSRSISILQNSQIPQKAPPVKFQQGRRIQGSQNWQGQKYAVFRNYQAQWHDRNWWHNHYHNNIVFVFGAPYFWN